MSEHDVVVIGAGCSGIGAAIRLRALGIESFAVLEKDGEVGGTWRDNSYPGCACDIPSALYSYSFAPNPGWTRAFARQPEIQAYLRATAERFGIVPFIRFGTRALESRWDPDAERWRITTETEELTARVLVAATGPWHEPLMPDLPGLEGFRGRVFHSSRWDHDYDLSGKRVAVIGTGASAIQFVPEIQPDVAELHVFQRTASWVLPKLDGPMPSGLMKRLPFLGRALRRLQFSVLETLGLGFRHPALLRGLQRVGLAHLRLAVRDPVLRTALTPDFTLGCKRVLLSNSWYRALTRRNVSVHPTAVAAVESDRVIGADGTEAEVDAIIFGTGFHITDMPIAEQVRDGEGRRLDDAWGGSPKAFLGTAVSGFPNLFLMLGPNLGTGHSSAFSVVEAQLDHIADAIASLRDTGWGTLEVRPEVQSGYNDELQRALAGTVYITGGCSSYFFDKNGNNSFNWPWSTPELKRRVGRFDPGAYTAAAVSTRR